MAFSRNLLVQELDCTWCAESICGPVRKPTLCCQCSGTVTNCKDPFCIMEVCPTSQTYLMEQYYEKTTTQCKNYKHGCGVAEYGQKILNHEESCAFEACPVNEECKWRGKYSSITDHIEKEHTKTIIVADSHTFSTPNFLQSDCNGDHIKVFYAYNKYFLFEYEINPIRNSVAFSVVVVGEPDDVEKFYFQLDLTDGECEYQSLASNSCPILRDVETRAFFGQKDEITLDATLIPVFCKNGDLTYTITVKQLPSL